MTIVAALITKHFTAHASDSFITTIGRDGLRKVVESRATKLIKVPAFKGAMAYWGLARLASRWNTKDWLEQQARGAGKHQSAEKFADLLARVLTTEIKQAAPRWESTEAGIGIHFTAYEPVDGYQIPELFLISNWADASYSSLRPDGFAVTRATFAAIAPLLGHSPEHREPVYRHAVRLALGNTALSLMLQFNNGDPTLFNPIAQAIHYTSQTLRTRRQIVEPDSANTHLSLVRRPIEVVSRLLSDWAKGTRVIGGKPHDLAISPHGEYTSTTGDG